MRVLRRALLLVPLCLLSFLFPASAADFEFKGKIDAQDPTSRLLAYYSERFAPEELFLAIDEQPDDTGRFRDLFMDLKGISIGGVRVDRLTFRMNDVQFNAPRSGRPEASSASKPSRSTPIV